MDAKELIDDIEKPAEKNVEEVAPGKCDHIAYCTDKLCLERASDYEAIREEVGDMWEAEDAYEVVFKYCPECGEKI